MAIILSSFTMQVEAIVVPTLDRERLDGLDPDEAAMEQSRQRIKMQVTLVDAVVLAVVVSAQKQNLWHTVPLYLTNWCFLP